MSRTADLIAMMAAGALGAVLTVLATGASVAFLVPPIVGVGLVAAITSSRAAPTTPPVPELGEESSAAGPEG